MKTKQLILSAAVLTMAVSISFLGCRKAPATPNDTDTSGAADNSLSEQSFNDMHQVSDEASTGHNSYRTTEYDGLLSICATVALDTANKKITIDFGSSPCMCHDGRWREGKIFVSYTPGYHHHGYWDSLCSITITTTDPVGGANTYFVGPAQNTMHQVIGTRNVINNGRNGAHHLNWSITDNNCKIIKANNQGTITWNSTRNREWTQGDSTPFIFSDDKYSITGSANGIHANASPFTMNITSPIVIDMSCLYRFVSGTFDYTPGSKPTRHVDYSAPSNGACDNVATVVINNHTYTIHF